MKKTVKKKWLEALRSKKYTQGTGELKSDDNKFCCLGVLCEIHRKTMKSKKYKWGIIYGSKYGYTNGNGGNSKVLPDFVRKWAGLDCVNPIPKARKYSLAGFNDNGRTFKQIADIIEKGL